MSPVLFPQCNAAFGPPSDLEESQCATIPAYVGEVQRGSVEGSKIVVVAWQPTPDELGVIKAGSPIFLSMMGGLAPHFVTTSFEEAVAPG